ncbi:MAG: TonB-dependent receptor, partial [Paramuribaculum sp.]|nr:TonB-dependent receptor [Paramuribaculum sp.]
GNKNLTWETSNSFNVGVDFGFWDRKLSGTVEYFNRQTSDMLYNRPTSPSLGYTSIPMNIGSMRNSGFEIELTYRPIATKNLVWAINANATFVNNKVLKLAPELGGKWINGSRIYREGESMYQLYMVKYAGVDKATGEALYWGFDTDDNGDKVPGSDFVTKEWKSAYRQSTGDLLPIVYGGFGTTLNAYGFDLGLAFSYQLGGKIYDQGYQYLMGSGASSEYGHNWHKDIRNAWTPENPNTNVPRLDAQAAYSYYSYLCDRGLITSNYLSLNNITLGYTLPSNFTKKFGVESLRIYGAADNVALWSARKGLDPRQSFTAATTSLYTALRCISGGLKVTF